jgi:hypothetical protein
MWQESSLQELIDAHRMSRFLFLERREQWGCLVMNARLARQKQFAKGPHW